MNRTATTTSRLWGSNLQSAIQSASDPELKPLEKEIRLNWLA